MITKIQQKLDQMTTKQIQFLEQRCQLSDDKILDMQIKRAVMNSNGNLDKKISIGLYRALKKWNEQPLAIKLFAVKVLS